MRPSESQVRSAITPRRVGALVEALDRHDREHLVDRPHVRDRLEHREVDEVLVDQALVRARRAPSRWLFSLAVQARAHARARSRRTGRRARARCARSSWPSAYSDWPSARWCCASWYSSSAGRSSSSAWISRRWRITAGSSACAGGTAPSGARSTSDDVDDQHRVVRGHRAAGLGDDARRRQPVLGAGLGQRLHDACARTGRGRS